MALALAFSDSALSGLIGLWIGFYVAQFIIGIYYSILLKTSQWKTLKTDMDI
jgi:Na+-driven multidrug efflux pump